MIKPLKTRSYATVKYEPLEKFESNDIVVQYFAIKHHEFTFFHQHASWQLVFTVWTLWAVCLLFVVVRAHYEWPTRRLRYLDVLVITQVGMMDLIYTPVWFWFKWFPVFSEPSVYTNAINAYEWFTAAGATFALIFFALEGTIFPLSWLLSQWIWYPLGNVTYTCYLTSIPTCFALAEYVVAWRGWANIIVFFYHYLSILHAQKATGLLA